LVFGVQHARRQAVGVVATVDRYHRLHQDRAVVQFRAHDMDGAAREPHARIQNPLMHVQPLERRQQGRVDVDNPVAPALGKRRRQEPHETREADELNTRRCQNLVHGIVEGFATVEVLVVDHLGCDPGLGSAL